MEGKCLTVSVQEWAGPGLAPLLMGPCEETGRQQHQVLLV